MTTTKLNNDLMQHNLDEAAWRQLSEDFDWSEQLLEKYEDKADWKEISANSSILWTVPMLEKFQRKLDWSQLSRRINSASMALCSIERFKNYWNWEELSSNSDVKLSYDLLDSYADRWDWVAIINRYPEPLYSEEFLYRYQEYIPISELQNSCLWRDIIYERKQSLLKLILSK